MLWLIIYSMIVLGIGAIVALAAKNAASKNHPKDILEPPLQNSISPFYLSEPQKAHLTDEFVVVP